MGKKKTKSKSKNAKKMSTKRHSQPSSPPNHQPPPTTASAAPPAQWVDLGDDLWKLIFNHLSPLESIRMAFTAKRFSDFYKDHGACFPISKCLGELAASKPLDTDHLARLKAHREAVTEWSETFASKKAIVCFKYGYWQKHPAKSLAKAIADLALPVIQGFKKGGNIQVKTEGSNPLPWTPLEQLMESDRLVDCHHGDGTFMVGNILPICTMVIKVQYELDQDLVEKYGYNCITTNMEIIVEESLDIYGDIYGEWASCDSHISPKPPVGGFVDSFEHVFEFDHVTVTLRGRGRAILGSGPPEQNRASKQIQFNKPAAEDVVIITIPCLVQSVRDTLTIMQSNNSKDSRYGGVPFWYQRALKECCKQWGLTRFRKLFSA